MIVTHRYAACYTCGKVSGRNNTLHKVCNGERTKAANTTVNKLLSGNNPYNQPWRPDGMPRKHSFRCYRLQIDIRDSSDRDDQVRLFTEARYERRIDNQVDNHSNDPSNTSNTNKNPNQPSQPTTNTASQKRKSDFAEFQQRNKKQKASKQSKHEKQTRILFVI